MILENPYIEHIDSFQGSNEFSYLANIFISNNSSYTNIPKGTIEYLKFWEDIKDKCLNGFTNSYGINITGHHFFYLNFCRIELQNMLTKKKEEGFPRFVDLDYEYFQTIKYCRENEKSFICVKGRRQGYSYKAACVCSHEFLFFPKSKSIIGAFLSNYSLGTMGMVLDNLNFINQYTEFRKQRNPDLKDFIVARYQVNLGGVKVWKGLHSEVQSITFKDRPEAAVGKSATWLVLDEAGIFPNITQTYGYTEPLIKDGSTYTGTALIFGSSGDMDTGSKYFYEMFINPRKYNLLDFSDPENPEKLIGYFSSALKGRQGLCKNPNSIWFGRPMIDKDGNSNIEAALHDIEYIREEARNTSDSKSIQSKITQFPLTWREAFLRNKGNVFSSIEMLEHLTKLETIPSLRDSAQSGELYFDGEGKIKWKLNLELSPIIDFPMGSNQLKVGCITIWEHPEFDTNQIPHNLYIAGCDPYDQDKSESGSLGSFFIYKRFYRADKTHDIIVAEYTGRPEFADQFYENCRKLCIYYNSKCLYENQLKGLKTYFEQKNCVHYLYEQPQIIKDIIKDSRVNRGYGIHMNRGTGGASGIKDQCELYLRKWLYEEREIDGIKMCNLFTIKSIPLLKELIAYNREGNFDRVIAIMLCILQTYELHKIIIESELSKPMWEIESFFQKKYFKKNTSGKVKY